MRGILYKLIGRYIDKCFLFKILSLLFILSLSLLNSHASEQDNPTLITETIQLKGIWHALSSYQQVPPTERINMFFPPLPEQGEFESQKDYQKRIQAIKEGREKTIEEKLRNEIKKEEEFKNTQFTLRFTHIPYVLMQDVLRKYLFASDEYRYIPFATGEDYSQKDYKLESQKTGQTVGKKKIQIDSHTPNCYRYKEKTITLRKKTGTAGEDTRPYICNVALKTTPYPWHNVFSHLTVRGGIFAVPPVHVWKMEEKDYSYRERIAYLTFSLNRYDMEKKRFPVIFPLSRISPAEKEWEYSRRIFTEWEHYTETYRVSSEEKEERWLIRFDELPTYIPLPPERAKKLREHEEDLVLEVLFKPQSASREISEGYVNYTLEVEFISAELKDGGELIYAGTRGQWKDEHFVSLPLKKDKAGWMIQPKFPDEDPLDGVNDPGSPSNPWIIKPQDPEYGPTYEVSTKYFYSGDFTSRKDRYYGTLPAKLAISLIPTVAYLRGCPFFTDRWAYGVTALGLYYGNFSGAFFAPGQPSNPYIIRKVEE